MVISLHFKVKMEVEDWLNTSDDSEAYAQDINEEEFYYASYDIPKLQFRKEILKARWNVEVAMAEVVEMKGQLWKTTGIVRRGKIYFLIEETLYLAEIGALHLLSNSDTPLSLKDIYTKLTEGQGGCCWEVFVVYRHLKTLGYIVGRHGIPWTMKSVRSHYATIEDMPGNKETVDKGSGDNIISELFCNLQLNEVRPLFDVYSPNSNFRKSSPGDPNFLLCLTSRDHPPSKQEIDNLERCSRGYPLKFCHVDHGRVSFFSFSKVELPVLP